MNVKKFMRIISGYYKDLKSRISKYKNNLKKEINQRFLLRQILNWIFTIIIYLVTFVVTILLIFIVDHYTQFFNFSGISNSNSSRYLLSSLIQSQAAILAIVITVTLIAVQLASSSYSPRVIKIFKNNPDFYILFLLYGLSIFSMSGILKIIPEENVIFETQDTLHTKINFALVISFFTFTMLVPYILNVLKILKPSTIIEELAKDITIENISKSDQIGTDFKNDANPLIPILDIIRNSCLRHDFGTTIIGLREINQSAIDILRSNLSKSEVDNLTLLYINELENFVKSTIHLGDDNSTKEIVKILRSINETLIEINYPQFITRVNVLSKFIGIIAIEKHLMKTAYEAINSIYEIGKKVLDVNSEISDQSILYLGDLARNGIEYNVEDPTLIAISRVRLLGLEGLKKNLDITAMKGLWSLELVGKNKGIYELIIHEEKWEEYTDYFEDYQGEVHEETNVIGGIESEISVFKGVVRDVYYFGKVSIKVKLYHVSEDAIRVLKIIGENAIKHRFDEDSVPVYLGHIGIDALGVENNKLTNSSLKALEAIGEAADKNLRETIYATASSLIRVGNAALEKELTEIATSSGKTLMTLESTEKFSASTINALLDTYSDVSKSQDFKKLYNSIKETNSD